MFWNKKEREGALPDLPPMKPGLNREFLPPEDHAEMPEIEETHGLPSFPDSPIKRGFSQSAIKDAVSNKEPEEEIPSHNEEKNFKIVEMEDEQESFSKYSPSISPKPREKTVITPFIAQTAAASIISEPLISEPASPPYPQKPESRSSDIFVKMDKFYSAKKALASTQGQLNNIDSVLKKIRETKLREEQELAAWEKEIMQAKSRIQEITKNIFEKS